MGGIISSIFGGDSKPAPPPAVITPAPPPVIEDTTLKAEQDADALRRRKGSAANILAGGTADGATGSPAVGTKALLGQ